MMKIAGLCLTVLPILVRCLDFKDLSMDSVSGNLLQPAHWSDTSFNLAKQFRLRNLVYSQALGVPRDPRLFPEENRQFRHKRRQKRDVVVSRMKEQVSSMAVGFYRQEQMLIPGIMSVVPGASSFSEDVMTTFILGYEQEDGTKLPLKVKVSPSGVVSIYHSSLNDGDSTPLTPLEGAPLTIPLANGSRVSELAMSRDPESGTSYLAVMVDLALDWPAEADRNSSESMRVNDPIEMPDGGRSRIYEFSLTSNWSYSYSEEMVVPSIEAKDGAFFVVDQALHLVIAHRGNYTLNTRISESILIKLFSKAVQPHFEIIQGYKGIEDDGKQVLTDLDFSTQEPSAVTHFVLHNRDFVVFANTQARNHSKEDEFSYVYRYKFSHSGGKYQLFQKLPTFRSTDVTFASIHDPYNPLNSQYFLIFANYEDGQGNTVDSFVYKWIGGKFLPFQSLKLDGKPVSVSSFEKIVQEEIDGKQVDVLQAFIVFALENNKLTIFQFDGHIFQEGITEDLPAVSHDGVSQVISSVSVLQLELESVILNLRYGNGMLQQAEVIFNTALVLNEFFISSGNIRDYVDYHRSSLPDTRAVYETFLSSPRRSDDPLRVENVDFGGSFSVDDINIIPEKLYKDEEGNTVGATSLAVDGKTEVDASLLSKLEMFTAGVETPFVNNVAALNVIVEGYEAKANTSVKTNQVNEISGGVIFHNLTITDTLKVEESFVDIEDETLRYIFTSDGATSYDLVKYMKEAIYLGVSDDVVINHPITFENIRVVRDYILHNLNGEPILNYWHSEDDSLMVPGTTFLSQAAVFDGDSTVSGTVAGIHFTQSDLLLKNGDQTLTGNWSFLGNLSLPSVVTDTINGFDLGLIDSVVTYTDESIFLTNTIIADNLIIPVLSKDTLDILHSDFPHEKVSEVHVTDLVEKSLKDGGGEVLLRYKFTDDVFISNVTVQQINEVQFPSGFVPFNDPNRVFEFNGSLILDNVVLASDKEFIVYERMKSGRWSYSGDLREDSVTGQVDVDSDGNLELLLLGPTNLTGYSHAVSARKNFTAVHFMENVTVTNLVIGYNMSQLETGLVVEGNHSLPELSLSNIVQLDKLVLSDSLLTVNNTKLNLTDVFAYAVERNLTTWPSTITSVTFSNMAEFLEDFSVASVNTFDDDYTSVDPQTDFLRVTAQSGQPFVFQETVSFTEDVSFTSRLLQDTENNTIQACDLGYDELCLCRDCGAVGCSELGGDCVLTDFNNFNTSLYTGTHSVSLDYFDDNSLKLTGDQVILPRLVFKGGFTAVNLKVTTDDCEINSVRCSDLALTNSNQTFTGHNIFHGSLYLNSDILVNEELKVNGTVDNEVLDEIYSDTLYHKLEDEEGQAIVQNMSQVQTFTENIFIETLQTNNVTLTVSGEAVDPTQLFSEDHVLNSPSTETQVFGNLVFEEAVNLSLIDATDPSVTWDGITLDNFFHNLLLNDGSDQTVSGDFTVHGNLAVISDLSSLGAETRINQVDIVDLAARALRISGANISSDKTRLGSVYLGTVETAAGVGIDLGGNFLGVDLADAVTKTVESPLVISANHILTGGLAASGEVAVQGDIQTREPGGGSLAQGPLLQFISGDSRVSKVRLTHPAGASAEVEPAISSVNNEDLAALRAEKWNRLDDTTLTYNLAMGDVEFNGSLAVSVLNSIDLVEWRDTYLSLSQHQNISADYTYHAHLVFAGDVSVQTVFVGQEEGEEGLLRTLDTGARPATEQQFADRHSRVIFRDGSQGPISTVLSPDSANVDMAVLLNSGVRINSVDLSEDVLTYKAGDSKTFTRNLTVNGNMKIVNGASGSGDLNLNDQIVLLDQLTNEPLISLVPGERYSDAVSRLDSLSSTVEISGEIEFSATPTFSDLRLEPGVTVNSADIGNCSRPLILTTDNCLESSGDQILQTTITFSNPDNSRNLTVDAVILNSAEAEVNNKTWEEVLQKMISKTAEENVTITDMKTFNQAEFSVDSGVTVNLGSLIFGLSSESPERVFDMSYPSGNNIDIPGDNMGARKPVMPELLTALNNIEHNSRSLPQQFLYHTPLKTETAGGRRIKNLDVFTGPGLLPEDATTEQWEEMPFHLVTFNADVETEEVSLTFSRLSQLEGDVSMTELDPAPSLATPLTYRNMKGHLALGDLVALRHQSDWYFLLTTLTENSFIESLIDGVSLNDGTVVTLAKWNDTVMDFETVQNMKQNWNDLQPVKLANHNCVVGCGVDSQVLCFSSGTSNSTPVEYLAPTQELRDVGECFKASSVEIEEDGVMLVMASNHNSAAGLVTILKYQEDSGTFSDIQTIPCYYCSFADVGKFEDEIFIVIMSESSDFIYIGRYDRNQGRFVLFQNLNLARPQEAFFYNRDGSLSLSVLAEIEQRKEIFTFQYQGSMSFVLLKEMSLNLVGVESHVVHSHALLGSQLISSTGSSGPGRTLSANTVVQATYKQTDTAAVRASLESRPPVLPLIISPQCKNMVLNYLEKLYQFYGGRANPQSYAKLALRFLPRPFLQFDTDSFDTPVQQLYEKAETGLMVSNEAEAYIIFYAYSVFPRNTHRNIDSAAFRGTGLVFQDKDGVLLMRFRIRDNNYEGGNAYRGFSILESCDGREPISYNNTFSTGNHTAYNPTETPVDGEGDDVQEICLMVHDFPLVDSLKNLSGVSDVAAVSIEDSSGNTFACGYMKHPQHAMHILIKEHPEIVNNQRLVLQN